MRHVLGEPERLELAHRLPDRRDAHPERAREILEPQRRAGRQLAHDDRLAQALQGGLRHRPVPDGGAFGDRQGVSTEAEREPHLIRCQTRDTIQPGGSRGVPSLGERRVVASAAAGEEMA